MRWRGVAPRPRLGAAAEVTGGGREELPRVRGQWWLGEATSRLRPGAVALRSHPAPEARGGARGQVRRLGGATRGAVAVLAQKGLEELSRVEGQELWW